MWEFVNFYFLPGVVLGCIYALGALGISLTFGILRFANFAHGEIMMLGAYFTLSLTALTGLPPLAAALPAMALTVAVTLALDRAAFRPFRGAPAIISVIASFGLMLMIRSAVQFFWGVQPRPLLRGIQRPESFLDGAILLPPKHIVIIGSALVLMVLVHLLLSRTRIGKAMRAVSDSPGLARLTGIDVEAVIRATWAVAAVTAVAAGVLLALDTHVESMMGFKMLLPMFAAAILGGIGRPFGAVAGGLVIGIAEEVSSFPFGGTEALLNPAYKSGIAFAIMVAMLIWRPSGLFKGRVF
ncbi:branched-chain amino acid ABC transporter permease [Oceanicella sp. SM1341]|uniref:branched-chain amino acid ABC transporter permease n=1 Tax=Oceanicella sp. SM1341 TaxID=1548889 RepID=UPI000E48B921|nr:branched-chain amino acid ABC transporter permease [Oceanicella sp. SM1341]